MGGGLVILKSLVVGAGKIVFSSGEGGRSHVEEWPRIETRTAKNDTVAVNHVAALAA